MNCRRIGHIHSHGGGNPKPPRKSRRQQIAAAQRPVVCLLAQLMAIGTPDDYGTKWMYRPCASALVDQGGAATVARVSDPSYQRPQADGIPGHGHAGHHHGTGDQPPPSPAAAWTRHRAAVLLAVVVVPLALATAVGVIALWPHGHGPQNRRLDTSYFAPGGTMVQGTITALRPYRCSGGDALPAAGGGSITLTCLNVDVRLASGPKTGTVVKVGLPPETNRTGVKRGDQLRLMHVTVGSKKTDYYAFVDFIRGPPMAILALAFAVVVIAVARLRGLRALLALGFAYAVLAVYILPALLDGRSPMLVGLTGSATIMFIVLYFAHGFSTRTTTALLGTLFGLTLTAALAGWATSAAHLTGLGSDDSFLLLSSTKTLNLSQIVLCGIIIAGLGILNDVTITQASAVWELYELSPTITAHRLFTGAMRIGRDHIASTVYTIAFAYAGAGLPILLLLTLYQRPLLTTLTGGELAEEVVRTLVSSISLVLAIPITTAIAVTVVKTAGRTTPVTAAATPRTTRTPGHRARRAVPDPADTP